MGTAYGRVKITVDDRQLQLLATRMLAMQKVMETTNKRLDSLQKELSTVEKGTAKASKSFDRAAKSSKGFDRGLVKAAKSSKVLNYALDKTLDNLPKIVKSFDQAQGIYKPFEKLAKTLIIFNRAGGGLSGLAQGLGQVNREASTAAIVVEKLTRSGSASLVQSRRLRLPVHGPWQWQKLQWRTADSTFRLKERLVELMLFRHL